MARLPPGRRFSGVASFAVEEVPATEAALLLAEERPVLVGAAGQPLDAHYFSLLRPDVLIAVPAGEPPLETAAPAALPAEVPPPAEVTPAATP